MNFEKEQRLRALFNSFDQNCDGYLSKGEFVAFSKEVLKIMERGGSNAVFKQADLNNDSKVSFSEFIELTSNV